MPSLEHIGNDNWTKICTICKTTFTVLGATWNEAHTAMLIHFGHSTYKTDELKSECKSCGSDAQNRRVPIQREELLAAQDGKCGICCKEISFKNHTAQVDHDHKTGMTRKVLCKFCNKYMATVDDDEWLKLGIVYRDAHRG